MRHCNYCRKDNHDESNCFNKIATLEEAMNKHHISLDSSSESTSHGHAFCAYGYSYTLLLQINGSLILEHLIIWLRIKPYFLLCMNVTPNKYLLVMVVL